MVVLSTLIPSSMAAVSVARTFLRVLREGSSAGSVEATALYLVPLSPGFVDDSPRLVRTGGSGHGVAPLAAMAGRAGETTPLSADKRGVWLGLTRFPSACGGDPSWRTPAGYRGRGVELLARVVAAVGEEEPLPVGVDELGGFFEFIVEHR